MTSRLALDDLEQLAAEGLTPSAADCIRLNAFGLEVDHASSSASFYNIPRCAEVGGIVFRELLIGHEIWLDTIRERFNLDDPETNFVFTGFAMTKPLDELPPPEEPTKVQQAINDFLSSCGKVMTRAQFDCAVFYVFGGRYPLNGEKMPPSARGEDEHKDESIIASSVAVGILHEAQSIGLGMSVYDIMRTSNRDIQCIISRALSLRGVDIEKQAHDRAVGRYYAALDEIRKRLSAEKEGK